MLQNDFVEHGVHSFDLDGEIAQEKGYRTNDSLSRFPVTKPFAHLNRMLRALKAWSRVNTCLFPTTTIGTIAIGYFV
ncbi:uncharacterized protein K489DRAFT_99301 [Dissoconium aciculare CBS 342.82]|uniref:Uncharacterized protein n=1 Tax=Dissoconium aciculare CBS 342.82 TaxID=1314786 RepID=A0A6J3MG15_9PEZI|nr:uncharacterized protein K489DRAFT_99301 [Dissoconium aciculare CBS 342.82]KAF1825827.1 hypothetical protein K489DRAFT_99301 [Dissoconium aciculare CBS 342.82]